MNTRRQLAMYRKRNRELSEAVRAFRWATFHTLTQQKGALKASQDALTAAARIK